MEPEVGVFSRLVDLVVQVLHHRDHRAVERPETELRHAVAFGLHLLHHGEEDLPLVPVTNRVGDIHHQHIHAGVGEHGHVLADDVLVLAQEVAHLRLAPMIRALRPERMLGVEPGLADRRPARATRRRCRGF